ncbi:response regulator [candidate division KSB1 bacterium]|nr:response regulator [candidate division KSB1 bacterium]RQW01164.1 MAG: response regulator [candidate division KSB1 bacterium]
MSDEKKKILWVDDEIDLLRPHVLFLQNKGYYVKTLTNAEDAVELVRSEDFDIILLDEMLHGMDGLTALAELKEINPGLPIIMVTKSEEESLMEEAIGSKIDDYLTKPVNPSQILLVCKKILDKRKIAGQIISRDYISEFSQISARIMGNMTWRDWIDIHIKLSEWDVELDAHPDLGLKQILYDQKRDCNSEFGRFVEKNYRNWLHQDEGPPLSVDVVQNYVLPHVLAGKNTVLLVIDALRLDQWLALEPMIRTYFKINRDYYYSILPTATPYARNAIFSGMFPSEIEEKIPEFWEGNKEEDDVSLNRFEFELLEEQLKRLNIDLKPGPKYAKILDVQESAELERKINEYASAPLSAVVLNFVDILAHSRSSSNVIKEMIPNEAAFRSTTRSWFEHSHLYKALRKLAANGNTIIVTSDHGSIRGLHGTKVIGDRETSTSLRYKYGKNIKVSPKDAMIINNPREYKLPTRGVNTNYIFAKEDYYFVYPTNYHYFLNYYADSFQHGGISLEEIILPIVTLEPK